ncbi:hypothetical protein AB0M50_56470, partial [Nonomuraea fuscirosea]|uniref:hypothetical protein n=1 Tax=Nonomuraea fuscirosea TaxID=1291556 RepID=UPI00342C3762
MRQLLGIAARVRVGSGRRQQGQVGEVGLALAAQGRPERQHVVLAGAAESTGSASTWVSALVAAVSPANRTRTISTSRT